MASFSVLKEMDDLNSLEKQVNEALLKASQGNLIPKPISLASLSLPQTALAEKATAYAKSSLNLEVFHHSMRSYYFGTAIASHHFPHFNWDPHTAYLAAMLHDVGLTSEAFALTRMSFEFHGGILAREFLLKEGASPRVSDTVAEAIFRHREKIHVDGVGTCGHSHEVGNNWMLNSNKKSIDNTMLTSIILKALNSCKRSRPKKSDKNSFPANPWYDEDCKAARKRAKKWGNNKEYVKLVRLKKDVYMQTRRKELILLGRHNPRGL